MQKIRLASNKLPPIPMISDSHGPIMRKKNINQLLDLHQFANIIFANMIHRLNGIMIIGRPLKVSYIKQKPHSDSTKFRNPRFTNKKNNLIYSRKIYKSQRGHQFENSQTSPPQQLSRCIYQEQPILHSTYTYIYKFQNQKFATSLINEINENMLIPCEVGGVNLHNE